MEKFEDIDYWQGIILFGLNQSTYKIALGKTIIEIASDGKQEINWDDLSKRYLDNYILRLKIDPKPQQSNPSRRTKMERIVYELSNNIINYDTAIESVKIEAFNDVIPRFQTIGMDKNIVGDRFYQFDFGKKLYLNDSVFKIVEESKDAILKEIDARWSLLEGAFQMVDGDYELTNTIRDIYIQNGYKRTTLTGNIDFLQGYQGNTCFYCSEPIDQHDIHVDHLLPRQFIQHDEIWNLVLSHSTCNLNKNDFLVGEHYFLKLIARNENIMGSNHPWKKKIADSLGATPVKRAKKMFEHYSNAKIVLRNKYWENSPHYNRENDPFFKKLITILNNK